ncbi:hypothetical protein F4818DRAFT_436023 [Hypoxylon cercidicola]|nr:hypothetical protein F4818DRAFT_436023 [Hypoxylon cercidicola]
MDGRLDWVPTAKHSVFLPSEQLKGDTDGSRNANQVGNYRGDPDLPTNRGDHVPEQLNTSIWITGLPKDITMSQLLDFIAAYKPGRVRSIVINEPTATNPTSAATISFFRRAAAETLFHIIQEEKMIIGGMIPRVRWNRNRVMEDMTNASRVLLIGGEPQVVNAEALDRLFHKKFVWQTDVVIDHGITDSETGPIARVEYRFGSFRSQAQFAKKCLKKELEGFAYAEYGADPCGD